jgi:hypothetical protein
MYVVGNASVANVIEHGIVTGSAKAKSGEIEPTAIGSRHLGEIVDARLSSKPLRE